MALLELIGRLGLNTSGFTTGLKQAESAAEGAAHKFSHTFAKAGFAFLGLHEGVRGIKALIRETIHWGENIEETKKEFEKLGLTIEDSTLGRLHETSNVLKRLKIEAASALAPLVGFLGQAAEQVFYLAKDGLNRMGARIGGFLGGGVEGMRERLAAADKKAEADRTKRAIADVTNPQEEKERLEHAKKLNEASLKTYEVEEKNRIAGMTTEEKKNELLAKQVVLRQILAKLGGFENAERREEVKQLIAQSQGEIDQIERAPRKSSAKDLILGTSIGRASDPLAAIGAFSGFREYGEKQLDELRIIAKNTEGLRLNL